MTLPKLHLTVAEFEALPEYSATFPTGQTPGKRWRRLDGAFDPTCLKPRWMIGEYDPNYDGKAKTIRINWYAPVIRVPAKVAA
jgi:hypothetical protein